MRPWTTVFGRVLVGGWLVIATGLTTVAVRTKPAVGKTEAIDHEVMGQDQVGLVRVGMMVYAGGLTGVCFADNFLAMAGRRTLVRVSRGFDFVHLSDEAVFDYPFLVMSGTGPFTLSPSELSRLGAYLERGGFLLASAGCSNSDWAISFQQIVEQLFGQGVLRPIGVEHPIFHTLYDIDRIPSRKGNTSNPILGLDIDGRLGLVFSPVGLNDTAHAGQGCCCCGGNELRHAGQINANILMYVLTH